jgi:CRP-like cAMP-binding protein
MDAATQRMLTRSPLLAGLRRDVVARVVSATEVRTLPRRATVWLAGDECDGLVLVRSGVLRETAGREGHEVLLRLPGRGEVVGEVALLAGGAHHTGLAAHEDAVVWWIPRAALDPLDLALARRLAATAAARCRRAEQRLAVIAYRTVEERLAVTVSELAAELGVRDSRGVIVNLRLTRRDLAALAGTTRESTSLVVSQWQRAGLVEAEPHRLVVLDPERLRRLAADTDEPPEGAMPTPR